MPGEIKRIVICVLQVEGFHRWKDAPDDPRFGYLKFPHRHIFHIRIEFKVHHGDREIEIINKQAEVEAWLYRHYGGPCQFDGMSCEDIAEVLLTRFDAASCEVLEDGYGGAKVVRQ